MGHILFKFWKKQRTHNFALRQMAVVILKPSHHSMNWKMVT